MESLLSVTVAPETNDTFSAACAVLSAAISDATKALVSWNIGEFESNVESQRELVSRIALHSEWRDAIASGDATAILRNIQQKNRVCKLLLEHSLSWTRTQQSILQCGGGPIHSHASIHFRG